MPVPRRSFSRNREGVAALEFAFIAPVLIALLLLGFDTARYVQAVRKIGIVASSVGQMLSVSTTGQIAAADLQFYKDSTMVLFPHVLADSYAQGLAWANDIGITVSSVAFSGTDPNYTAAVSWSAGTTLRPCNTSLTAVSNNAKPTPTTLPSDVFGPGSLVVVDLNFRFRPLIASQLMGPISITRSYYVQPRYVASLSYTGSAGPAVNKC